MGFPGGSDGKESACNVGDPGLTLGWEDTLEKELATHFSILAWRIPWRKCGIEPQESTRIFSSISPPKKPESAYCIALCSHL